VETGLTEEQTSLGDAIDTLLDREWVAPHEVPSAPAARRERVWERLVEFGVLGAGDGAGAGLGAVELCLVARSLGSHLASVPFAGSAAVRLALAGLPSGAAGPPSGLAGLLASEDSVALAILEPGGGWTLEGPFDTRLSRGELHGDKVAVERVAGASRLAVVATLDGEPTLAITSAGVASRPQPSFDETVPMSAVSFRGTPVADVLMGSDATYVLERLMTLGTLLAAAEACGAAAGILELARRYARDRRQFGHAIGSFQAVRHILADGYARQVSAWSAVLHAAAAFDTGDGDVDHVASIAKAYTSRGAREVAHGAMQVFGGIAFTEEHPAHRFLRRIVVRERQFGDAAHHERLLGRALAERARSVFAEPDAGVRLAEAGAR
jgi:alkylation response protein AidB-like acyl-CoA dehydrogenase